MYLFPTYSCFWMENFNMFTVAFLVAEIFSTICTIIMDSIFLMAYKMMIETKRLLSDWTEELFRAYMLKIKMRHHNLYCATYFVTPFVTLFTLLSDAFQTLFQGKVTCTMFTFKLFCELVTSFVFQQTVFPRKMLTTKFTDRSFGHFHPFICQSSLQVD